MFRFLILSLYFLLLTSLLFPQTVFTCRSPESINDTRHLYDNALLKLALDKTVESDGEYILEVSPSMNTKRMKYFLLHDQLTNPIFKSFANNDMLHNFSYINFPIELGIGGYRVFFVSPEKEEEFESVRTLNDLKKFSIIQGAGWIDISILRNAGFKVDVLAKYESLFVSVAKSRSDLFSRAITEVKNEMLSHTNLEGLNFNDKIIMYYPLPRFFFTTKGNEEALDRIERGIWIAYNDGSLVQLWESYHKSSIDFVGMKDKIIIPIENPLISDLDKSYEKYFYKF